MPECKRKSPLNLWNELFYLASGKIGHPILNWLSLFPKLRLKYLKQMPLCLKWLLTITEKIWIESKLHIPNFLGAWASQYSTFYPEFVIWHVFIFKSEPTIDLETIKILEVWIRLRCILGYHESHIPSYQAREFPQRPYIACLSQLLYCKQSLGVLLLLLLFLANLRSTMFDLMHLFWRKSTIYFLPLNTFFREGLLPLRRDINKRKLNTRPQEGRY